MMRLCFLFMFGLALLCPVTGFAFSPSDLLQECPKEMPHADIRVSVAMFDPPVYRNYSFRELDGMKSHPSPYPSDQLSHTYGMKSGPIIFMADSKIASQTNPLTKKSCYWYANLNLTIQLKPEIYIAKEIQPHSCYEAAVLKHELRHADIDRELLRDFQPIITQTLTEYVMKTGMLGGVSVTEQDAMYQRLKDALDNQMNVIHHHIEPVREQRQAQIDTVESYDATAAPCRGTEDIPR